MKRAIASLLVTLLGLALLVYSATRSIDFITLTLPADRQILAWFGLAALDGGLVFWLLYFLHGAAGAWQKGAALLMTGVDLLGAVAMFTLDTLYRTGEKGMTVQLTPDEIQAAVLALSGVIAVNIAATVFCHLTDPEARKKQAAEEAQDQIEELALKRIQENAQSLAAELAPQLADDWMIATRARYLANVGSGRAILPATVNGQARDPKAEAAPQSVEAAPVPLAVGGDNHNGAH
jgi:hypothetical protein